MHVARSAYRQLLRVGKKVAVRYSDPNDMCFALFGILVSRHDFINAGYGSTFPSILRTCFLRPSVAGDPHDTSSARTSAAFDALRRLNELNASNAAFRIRELRRSMSDTGDQKGISTVATASTSTISTSVSSLSSTADPVMTLAPQTTAPTTAVTCPLDEEGVHLIRGSVLIERSSRRRIQNFTRHCVVCEPINMTFPPYRFCVPPEPSYLLAVRSEFALYAITDVLLALAATSIYNAYRQAHMSHHQPHSAEVGQSVSEEVFRLCSSDGRCDDGLSDQKGVGNGTSTSTRKKNKGSTWERRRGAAPSTSPTFPAATSTTPSLPETRCFPTAYEELQELVRRIPTRTVVQTDVLEVEITTEYVCSNPSVATATSSSAADYLSKQSKVGAFASTTPLKRGLSTGSFGSVTSTNAMSQNGDTQAHLFLYHVYIRNRGPLKNPKKWHAQVLSHHLVVVDVAQAQVLEMGRPGVVGNFPLLQPGASHCFESGATLSGPEGLLRGSIQINLFNDSGEVMMLDAAIAPTRLTVEVTNALGFVSTKNAKEELTQRSRGSGSVSASEGDAELEREHSCSADDLSGVSNGEQDSCPKSKGEK